MLAFFVHIMDWGRRFGSWLLRTEYVRAGGCQQRGVCCHHVLFEWSPLLERHPLLAKLVLFKMTRIYSFYDRGYTWQVEDGLLARVLGCYALREDGRCGEYRTRPLICRAYPELPLIGKPVLHNGCGFRFVRRDGQPEAPEGESPAPAPRRLPLV